MLAGINDALFSYFGTQLTETGKANMKSAAKAALFFFGAIAIIKTLEYLTNSKGKSADGNFLVGRDDDNSDEHDACNCHHTHRREISQISTDDAPVQENPSTPTKVEEIATTIISSSSPAEEENSSWFDFFSSRFEKLEVETGTNPWSVPSAND